MDFNSHSLYPEGVISLLDTDLYKLTMQCAVYRWFRHVPVTYAFTNRTPEKRLSRPAFRWLETQIRKLGNISLSIDEYSYLQRHCPYLDTDFLAFLREFRLNPHKQVSLTFTPITASPESAPPDPEAELGDVSIKISGTWVDTILYEIPILALTSEAYFRFLDKDWDYEGQEEQAYNKGMRLLEGGCVFSEFGTRRRRDYHTQALVFRGLNRASKEAQERGLSGKLSGTSNVHLAMRFDMAPIGTVAHEWFMGIAALTGDYTNATETALRHWVATFGNKLTVALTDTFGTEDFIKSFNRPIGVIEGGAVTAEEVAGKTYAQFFAGVRQDSGDPETYVYWMQRFYANAGISDRKTIVFSDSLDVDKCLRYKAIAEDADFSPTFGVGTFLTNDFVRRSDGSPSKPMNIVIKLSSANGRPAVKISDNAGKNTGDKETVQRVKKELGYVEHEWKDGDETTRWGAEVPAARAVEV
jgi:nicotinate phosphoribosyltransferase